MSYNEDYKDVYQKNEKIPFDDTPIVRIPQARKNVSIFNRPKTTSSQRKTGSFKLLVACVAVLILVNIVLSGIIVWNITSGGAKNVNVFQNSINVSGSDKIHPLAYNTARFNSVCISAGGSGINKISNFFSNANSRGSGVIYKKDEEAGVLYILTCYHVVQGNEKNVYVLFTNLDEKPYKASVVGYSEDYDVAVLKVDNLKDLESCLAIQIQNSQYVSFGEPVLAVGNALSGGLSMSCGVVSRINKEIKVDGYTRREIQIDAAINPGSSGGGLFDAEGKFIGLVNAKLSTSSSGGTNIQVEGIAYAIPGNLAIGIAESIIQNKGRPTTIRLNVEFAHDANYPMSPDFVGDSDNRKVIDHYKVVVEKVNAGIASDLLKKGDVVLSFQFLSIRDGQWHEVLMYNKYCFDDFGFEITKGSVIKFKVTRGISNEEVEVSINASELYTPN